MHRAATYLLLVTVLLQPWLSALASCCPMLPPVAVAQERVSETAALTPTSCHGGSEHDQAEQTDPDLTASDSCGDHSACANCQAGACGHASSALARNTKTLNIGESAQFAAFGGALSPAAGFDRSLLRPPSIS